MKFEREFFYDEVREGFYVPGMMKRAWGAQLKVLEEIDRVCKRYDIHYQICAGTLLGAVRHGGFIPWDDDIDILMLPEEFEKFSYIADELPKELVFNYVGNDEEACKFCATVEFDGIQDKAEILRKYCEFPYPTCVDIFYLDELSDNSEEEAYRQNVLKMLAVLMNYGLNNGVLGKSFQRELKKVESLLQIHLDREKDIVPQLYRIFDRVRKEFNGRGGKNLAFLQYHITNPNLFVYPKTVFQKTRKLSFCGVELPAPKDYDTVLRLNYAGDYRKVVKGSAEHQYPFFRDWENEFFRAGLKILPFSEEEEKKRQEMLSFRDFVLEEAKELRSVVQDISVKLLSGDFLSCLSLLSKGQEEAIRFGKAIEQIKGEGTKSVSVLEKYCEILYLTHQAVMKLIDYDEKEVDSVKQTEIEQTEKEQTERVRKERERIKKEAENLFKKGETSLCKLRTVLKTEFMFKIVFLPHRAKHFSSLRPLIDALLQKGDTDCEILPIPYYDRLGDGSLSEKHYEGADFPKEYAIKDYRTYDFEKELPDAIVIHSPYDEFNQVFTVDPFFYSREMKKFTKKLIYIPWFVTDEINPQKKEDQPAYSNMDYYVTVPGVFHADLTIVQSKEMRKTYLAKIREFTNKEVRKKMRKKISGAGSCLLGEKEGQGVKEVVTEFRRFLNSKHKY